MDQFSYSIDDKNVLVYRSVYTPVKSNMFTINLPASNIESANAITLVPILPAAV